MKKYIYMQKESGNENEPLFQFHNYFYIKSN